MSPSTAAASCTRPHSLDEMLDYEAVAATLSSHTADAREGTSAFVEKRRPKFQGR